MCLINAVRLIQIPVWRNIPGCKWEENTLLMQNFGKQIDIWKTVNVIYKRNIMHVEKCRIFYSTSNVVIKLKFFFYS